MVAVKKGVPLIHVEAGLRSFDRSMPEEINRVLTDQLAELLFTTEREALANLTREGIDPARVHFVGNVMIDTLLSCRQRSVPAQTTLASAPDPGLFLDSASGYGVVTLHRPANVDDPKVLSRLLRVLTQLSTELPLVFPVHPRTEGKIREAALVGQSDNPRLLLLPPQGYLEMIGLIAQARLVLTDSGGIQEESTALGVPCVTLRDTTERPITVTQGTNTVVGSDPERIRAVVWDILSTGGKVGKVPELWDGHAAERIAQVIATWVRQR
jgi:UDP-N-acetylglucosamine 2-epimerase (non-hydrolysing)